MAPYGSDSVCQLISFQVLFDASNEAKFTMMGLANDQVLRFVDNLANKNMMTMLHDTEILCDSVGRNPPSLLKDLKKRCPSCHDNLMTQVVL